MTGCHRPGTQWEFEKLATKSVTGPAVFDQIRASDLLLPSSELEGGFHPKSRC